MCVFRGWGGVVGGVLVCQDDLLLEKDATFRLLRTSPFAGPWMAAVGIS